MSASTSISSTTRRTTMLNPEETELWELCYYGGVMMDPKLFCVILNLLHMDVHPKAILDVLKRIVPSSKYTTQITKQSAGSKEKSTKSDSKVKDKDVKGDSKLNSGSQLRPTSKLSSTVSSDKQDKRNASSKSNHSSGRSKTNTSINRLDFSHNVQSSSKK